MPLLLPSEIVALANVAVPPVRLSSSNAAPEPSTLAVPLPPPALCRMLLSASVSTAFWPRLSEPLYVTPSSTPVPTDKFSPPPLSVMVPPVIVPASSSGPSAVALPIAKVRPAFCTSPPISTVAALRCSGPRPDSMLDAKVPPRSSVALPTTMVPVLTKVPTAMSSVAPLLMPMVPVLSNSPGPASVNVPPLTASVIVPLLITSSVNGPGRPAPTMICPWDPTSFTHTLLASVSVAPLVAVPLCDTARLLGPPWPWPNPVVPRLTTALASVCEPRKSNVA